MFYAERKTGDLIKDFFGKCYICECKIKTGIEIEHRIPKAAAKTNSYIEAEWNRFLACERCNGKKSNSKRYYKESSDCICGNGYLGIIDCTKCDPYKYIKLKFKNDLVSSQMFFIKVIVKKDALCNEFTKRLLETIYSPNVKVLDQELRTLLYDINESIQICSNLLDKLMEEIVLDGLEFDILKTKTLLTWEIHPEAPFSAFTRTYVEERFDDIGNLAVKSALEDVLNDPSLHPTTLIDCK